MNSNYFSDFRFHSHKCLIDFSLKDRNNFGLYLPTARNNIKILVGSQKQTNKQTKPKDQWLFPNLLSLPCFFFLVSISVSENFIFRYIFLNFVYKIQFMSCIADYIVQSARNFGNCSKKQSKLSDISVIEFLWELTWFVSLDFTVKRK